MVTISVNHLLDTYFHITIAPSFRKYIRNCLELEPKLLFLLRNLVRFGHNTSCFTKIFQVVVITFITVIYTFCRSILIWTIPSWKPFQFSCCHGMPYTERRFLKAIQTDCQSSWSLLYQFMTTSGLSTLIGASQKKRMIPEGKSVKVQNPTRVIERKLRPCVKLYSPDAMTICDEWWEGGEGMLKTNENTTTRFPIVMWV